MISSKGKSLAWGSQTTEPCICIYWSCMARMCFIIPSYIRNKILMLLFDMFVCLYFHDAIHTHTHTCSRLYIFLAGSPLEPWEGCPWSSLFLPVWVLLFNGGSLFGVAFSLPQAKMEVPSKPLQMEPSLPKGSWHPLLSGPNPLLVQPNFGTQSSKGLRSGASM